MYRATMKISEGDRDPYTVTVHLADRYPRRKAQDLVNQLSIQLEVAQFSLPTEEVQGDVVGLEVLGKPNERDE